MDFSKYYNLEQYLFTDVRNKFNSNGFLDAKDFFCIVIWKANRAKTNIKKKLIKVNGNLDKAVRFLTEEIFLAKNKEEKLDVLLKKWKFGLPMATAILTVLYPNEFSVYDYRVREQIGLPNISTGKKYFLDFLPKVQESPHGQCLRDKDKYLWGKSFYEDLNKLVCSD
ncbi:hypothetical protein C4572_00120 [Candidatus Parcubacteria bacterium]|nr:MAG: hypothetical protein C4572_00120 [Candidatus Parcubacteria bacterium]